MPDQDDLDAVVEGLRRQLEQLESEADALRQTIQLLERRQQIYGDLARINRLAAPPKANSRSQRLRKSGRPPRKRPPRLGSIAALAVQLIRQNGAPLTTEEITAGLHGLGKQANPDSVARILRREVAEASVLIEVRPGKIGLTEWKRGEVANGRQLSLESD